MDKQEKRISRCLCLQILYANNTSGSEFEDVFDNFFEENNKDFEYTLSKEQIAYASNLFQLTLKHDVKIDKMIESKLVNWEIKRLARMDKMILRMAIAEMIYMDSVPPKVSISEGVEIAKEYSTVDSSSFVNGILDAIYNEKC
tara:strand:- start:459 stop:887 length:429 start_codon:yes stop_codon:yes gene_type:complete